MLRPPTSRAARLAARLGTLRAAGSKPWLLLPLAGLGAFALLFVGWDVVANQLAPAMPTALRHALLTASAGLVAGLTSMVVYLVMRYQHRRLSATAERLARVIGSYPSDPAALGRFENPHLVHCRQVLDCRQKNCPVYDAPGQRCWQVLALNRLERDTDTPRVDIEQCFDCAVYRRCCPDKLTELGESFNNLVFLLRQEAGQLGRMRAQMLERQKMAAIGQIAAGVAHEVGNPLSSISAVVQVLKRKSASTAVRAELDLIEAHIQRISATVRQLISLARPGASRWERADVRQILDEAVRLIRFDRRARLVHIDWLAPPALPPTFALRGQLQQVFLNLGLNALDAMPQGGRLTIRARRRGGRIVVRLEDTGCGIPPELGRRIFDPFFTTKEPGRGTGLGLAVSYGVIQKHGGQIDFTSRLGEGTVFTVEIPILDAPPET